MNDKSNGKSRVNNMRLLFSGICRSSIPRRAAVMLVTLAWTSLAFCGEIHDAAQAGDVEKVKALLKGDPDLIFAKDDYGETPLHRAASGGYKGIVELLLANKAEVNAKDNDSWTPLHYGAEKGHKDVAELLLANNAYVNAKANSGFTPSHLASVHGHDDVAALLREHGGLDTVTTATTDSTIQETARDATPRLDFPYAPERHYAVTQLTDQMALEKTAHDRDSEVRLAAVTKLTNQTVLVKIALEDESSFVREAAVRKLTDQAVLAKIVVEDKNTSVRLQAVAKLTDQNVLAKIAGNMEITTTDLVEAAARMLVGLEDPVIIMRIPEVITLRLDLLPVSQNYRLSPDLSVSSPVHSVSGERIHLTVCERSKVLVEDYWNTDFPTWVSPSTTFIPASAHLSATIAKLFSQPELGFTHEDLLNLTRSHVPEIRAGALENLGGEQSVLVKIAEEDGDFDVRKAAVERLKKLMHQAMDPKNALGGKHIDTLEALVEELKKDEPVLAKIAVEGKYSDTGQAIVNNLIDQSLLEKVAVEAKESVVRESAKNRLADLRFNQAHPELRWDPAIPFVEHH
jgi:ankyrin repeat protein